MTPGTWSTCGTEKMPLLSRSDAPHPALEGVEGPKTTITAFTGSALTPQYMVFHGGGHRASGMNEVYGFDYHNLEWEILSPAYGVPDGDDPASYNKMDFCNDPYPDGTPNARHTYGGIVYVPWTDTIWKVGGVGYCDTTSGMPGPTLWEYDLKKEGRAAWTFHGAIPGDIADYADSLTVAVKAVPWEAEEKIFVAGRRGRVVYDTAADTWQRVERRHVFFQSGHIHQSADGSVVVYYDGKRLSVGYDGPNSFEGVKASGEPWGGSAGVAWDPRNNVVVVWNGAREIRTWDPETDTWEQFANPEGPAPTRITGIYSKFHYLPDYDVFVGYANHNESVWFYRLPEEPMADERRAELESQGFTCADSVLGWECPSLSNAVAQGDEVTMPKGDYRQCAVIDRPTILDMQGSRVSGRVCEGKAVFVQNADFTLKNAEVSGAQGNSGNEAGIRGQSGASNLTLQNVTLRNNYNGILSTSPGVTRIENSLIEGNGCCAQVSGMPAGRAHGVYIRDASVLEIVDSTFGPGMGEGHLVKSGAARTVIEGSILDERDGNQSRAIDAFNGGELVLRDVTIHARSDDGNPSIIGYNYERRRSFDTNRVSYEGVTVHCDTRSQFLLGRLAGAEVEGHDSIEWPNGAC